jgi:hypothetical protein
LRAGWLAGGLVVAAGVEGELAEELAGCLADDPDVQVLGEDEDLGSGVSAAGADVVELAGVAEGDCAGETRPRIRCSVFCTPSGTAPRSRKPA